VVQFENSLWKKIVSQSSSKADSNGNIPVSSRLMRDQPHSFSNCTTTQKSDGRVCKYELLILACYSYSYHNMQQPLSLNQKRIDSIDVLRGIAMILMALDHSRDYIHLATDDPLNLATTTPFLFFTRWVTHFCAPIFVFLSGTSIYLQSLRKTKKELSAFVIKRGLWLIFAEVAINTLFWTFNPFYNFINIQVLWAIGISMVILGLLIRLPFKFILILGILIVFGHNLLDIPESAKDFKPGVLWTILHKGGGYFYAKNYFVLILYPFVPWTGLMLLGYCTGIFFSPAYTEAARRKIFLRTGLGLLAFFILIRFINVYGNPEPWGTQKNWLFTILSFIDIHKYPPSLIYMCVTIGFAFLFLALIERIKNGFTDTVRVFGRTAFFYYLLHVFLIHAVAGVLFFTRGHNMHDAMNAMYQNPFLFIVQGEGYGLPVVYAVWIGVLVILYPLCKWYDKYKTNHKEKWWLSYL